MNNRKLDALFAERVLGCKPLWVEDWVYCGCGDGFLHSASSSTTVLDEYTTSLDAAWEGVEKLDADWNFHLFRVENGDLGTGWHAELSDHRPSGLPEDEAYGGRWIVHRATDPTPALAIVLACLRAVGVSEEEIREASA